MKSGSTETINWDFLNRLVDPEHNDSKEVVSSGIGFNADHTENAMNGLNRQQRTIKDRLVERYEIENQDASFIQECEQALKTFIIEQYNKNPAIYNGKALPLEYDANHQSKAEQALYFQNPWHSAYRYIVLLIDNRPNPWLCPYAGHLARATDNAGVRYRCPDISGEHRALIRAMWVALNDGEFKISPMYTEETAKLELIRTIASLGRAHNWDQTRPVMETYTDAHGRQQTRVKTRIVNGLSEVITEEYDDLALDKPSCVWGVETRLTQFIMLALQADANETELKSTYVRDKFREEMVGEAVGKNTVFGAIDAMDAETLTQLSVALENHIIMGEPFASLTPIQQSLIKQIQCYTPQDIAQFLNSCITQWGAYRFTQRLNTKVEFQGKNFENYGQLALYFAKEPLGIFYEAIEQRIRTRLEGLNANTTAVDPVIEDLETLRAQLSELSMRLGDGAFLRYQTADEATIRQAATRYRLQLARPEEAIAAVAAHKAQEEARQAEIAHQAELRRQQEELRLQEEAQQEVLRNALLEDAFASNDELLALQILEYSPTTLRQEHQRLLERQANQRRQQEEAMQSVAQHRQVEQALPALLMVYNNLHQAPSALTPAVAVKAEIANAFTSENARQVLTVINQSARLLFIINQYSLAAAQRLATLMDKHNKLNRFITANQATKTAFLTAFAERQGIKLEAFQAEKLSPLRHAHRQARVIQVR